MAVTELALLWLGSLATLATVGLFVNFEDRATEVVLAYFAAIVWGMFGLSAWDVIMPVTGDQEPITPLVYLGLGLSFVVFVLALDKTKDLITAETGATGALGLGR